MFSSGQRIGTTILSSFIFLLSAPCFYLIFKILFGKFLGLLFSVFYVLLALFPYKLFYGGKVDLSSIWFYPVPTTIFGSSGVWVVIFYFAVSLFVATAYWFYKTNKFFPVIEKKQVLVPLLLLLAALIQIGPRLGKNSPKCVKRNLHRDGIFTNIRTTKFNGFEITERNLHRDDVVTNIRTTKFYGFETGGNDVFHASSGNNGEIFWSVQTLCEGPIEGIATDEDGDMLYLGNKRSQEFGNKLDYWLYTGTGNQTFNTQINAVKPDFTDPMRYSAYLVWKLTWDEDLYQGLPKRQAVIKGRLF